MRLTNNSGQSTAYLKVRDFRAPCNHWANPNASRTISPSPSPAIVTAYKRRVPFRLHPARFGLKCTNCGCDLDNQAAERRAAGNASVLPSPSIGRART